MKQNAAMTVAAQRITRNKWKPGDPVVNIKMDMNHSHVRQPPDTNGSASVAARMKSKYPSHSAHSTWRSTPFVGIVYVEASVNMNRLTADIAALLGMLMCFQTWK